MDRNLVSNATSSDDSPTPGYMLSEIARSTIANYQSNTQLQEYLIARLSKNNHNIKYKCLVIIKHVCRTGRPEFKREIARHVEPIKECLQYKGPPDPLRGDEIYKRVREAARETLDAIYDGQAPVTTSAVAGANRIQGMGNDYTPNDAPKPQAGSGYISNFVSNVQNRVLGDGTDSVYSGHPGATGSFSPPAPYGGTNSYNPNNGANAHSNTGGGGGGGGGGHTTYSSSGMQGLGNPNFQDSREEKSWVQRASDLATKTYNGASASSNSGNGGSSRPPFANSGASDYNYSTNRGPNAHNSGQQTYAPQQPKNAFASNSSSGFTGGSSGNGGAGGGGMVPDMPYGQPGTGRAGAAASDGKYEQSLIETLCEPGGLKTVPAEEKLRSFLEASSTLSADIVGACLLDVLNSESYQSRVKALMVISDLVKHSGNHETHGRWWQERVEEVRSLLNDAKPSVRTQASRTLRVLEKDSGATTTSSSVTSASTSNYNSPVHAPPAPRVEASLLESYDDILTSPHTDGSGSSSGLFEGMSLGGAVDASPTPPAIVYQAPAPPLPVAAPVVANTVSDIFNFLDDASDAPLPPAPAPWAPPVQVAPPQPPQYQQQQPAAPVSIFDSMELAPIVQQQQQPQQQFQQAPSAPISGGGYSNDLSSLTFGGPSPAGPGANPMLNGGGGLRPVMQQQQQQFYGQQQQQNQQFQQQQHQPQGFNQNGGYRPQQQQFSTQPPQGFQQQGQPFGGSVGGNVLAPGMLSHSAPRKNIPGTDGGNSGFSFLGSGGPVPASGYIGSPGKARGGKGGGGGAPNDSFGFLVADQISSMSKKT